MSEELVKNKQGLTEEEFLKEYDASIFERPSVTVDMMIFTIMGVEKENYRKLPEKNLKILMIKRGDHPYMAQWALPGGFVSAHESIDEAARRELKTETNVDNIYMEQLYTFGDVNRDPRTRVISCSYMALVDSSSLELKAGEDAAEAKWFNVRYRVSRDKDKLNKKLVIIELWNDDEKLSAEIRVTEEAYGKMKKETRGLVNSKGIAFDHGMIIAYALERLRNKIEYTDIVFNLMPELFTLTELQQVYEVILDKELLAAAFRRKVADRVIETDEFTKDAGHRPSKLYRFNNEWGKNQ